MTIDNSEALVIAAEAIVLAELHISACPAAEARLKARQALDNAERQRTNGAARPALMWACKAVQHTNGIVSPAYAEVQAKYDIVYNSHLAGG